MTGPAYALLMISLVVPIVAVVAYASFRKARGPRARRFALMYTPLIGAYILGYLVLTDYLRRRHLARYDWIIVPVYIAGLLVFVWWGKREEVARRREGQRENERTG